MLKFKFNEHKITTLFALLPVSCVHFMWVCAFWNNMNRLKTFESDATTHIVYKMLSIFFKGINTTWVACEYLSIGLAVLIRHIPSLHASGQQNWHVLLECTEMICSGKRGAVREVSMKRVSLQFCCQNGPLHLSAIFLHKDQQCTATSISLTHINRITVNPELLDSSKMHEVERSKEADTWTRLNIPLLYKFYIQHANRNATCTRYTKLQVFNAHGTLTICSWYSSPAWCSVNIA